jgi:hypothetical protein
MPASAKVYLSKNIIVFIISSYFLDKVYCKLRIGRSIAISAPFRCQRTNLLSGEFGLVTVLQLTGATEQPASISQE